MEKNKSIFDVAKYVVEKYDKISIYKLQKLCYYAFAWHLVWTGEYLFDEDFYAWNNGVICNELQAFYEKLQELDNRFFYILKEDFVDLQCNLSNDEKDSINKVVDIYGDLNADSIRQNVLSEEPWKNAYEKYDNNTNTPSVITKRSIFEYFASYCKGD